MAHLLIDTLRLIPFKRLDFPSMTLLIIRLLGLAALVMVSITTQAQPIAALNPDVHQDTIKDTICVVGYTKTVRPSASYTNGIKRRLLREAGRPIEDATLYELDHIIPLALGGHPRSLINLMLQPWEGQDGAKRKDKLEVKLQCLVCTGQLELSVARAEIFNDWQAAGRAHSHKRCSRRSYQGD
jgi:hypothetical protein